MLRQSTRLREQHPLQKDGAGMHLDTPVVQRQQMSTVDQPLIEHIERQLDQIDLEASEDRVDLGTGVNRHTDLVDETFSPQFLQHVPQSLTARGEQIARMVHEQAGDTAALQALERSPESRTHAGRIVSGDVRMIDRDGFGDDPEVVLGRQQLPQHLFAASIRCRCIDDIDPIRGGAVQNCLRLLTRRESEAIRDSVVHTELGSAQSDACDMLDSQAARLLAVGIDGATTCLTAEMTRSTSASLIAGNSGIVSVCE